MKLNNVLMYYVNNGDSALPLTKIIKRS